MVTQNWVFDTFSQKGTQMITSLKLKKKKQTWQGLVANDKIWPFEWKLGEFASVTMSLTASQDFSIEICGDINECGILMLSNKMCQHWQDLQNPYFPNDPYAWCYKPLHGWKSIWSIKQTIGFYCNRVQKVHWYRFRVNTGTSL